MGGDDRDRCSMSQTAEPKSGKGEFQCRTISTSSGEMPLFGFAREW